MTLRAAGEQRAPRSFSFKKTIENAGVLMQKRWATRRKHWCFRNDGSSYGPRIGRAGSAAVKMCLKGFFEGIYNIRFKKRLNHDEST